MGYKYNKLYELGLFKRHHFENVFELGTVPQHLPTNCSEAIGIDEKYFKGEKEFDPIITVNGKTYHEACDQYWEIKDNQEKNKEDIKELDKVLFEFANKCVKEPIIFTPNNDVFKLMFYLKTKGKLKADDIPQATFKIINLTGNLKKINLKDFLETDLEKLNEYQDALKNQLKLVEAAITLLDTDSSELNKCIKALERRSKGSY